MKKDMIVVKHVMQEKQGTQWKTVDIYPDFEITLQQFRKSFIDERWHGERRYNRQYTKLGYFHTKTIVYNPHVNTRSVRSFIFPE